MSLLLSQVSRPCCRENSALLDKESLPRHDKQDDGDCHVAENNAHPNLLAQRIQEAEDPGFLLDGLLYHDADAERHERFAEVDHALPFGGDGHGSDRYVGFLRIRAKQLTGER